MKFEVTDFFYYFIMTIPIKRRGTCVMVVIFNNVSTRRFDDYELWLSTYPSILLVFFALSSSTASSVKMLRFEELLDRSSGGPLAYACRLPFSRGHFLGDDRALLAHDLTRVGEIGEAGESFQVLQRAVSHDIQRVTEHLPLGLCSGCTAAKK